MMNLKTLARNILVVLVIAVFFAGCKDSGPSTNIYVKNGKTKRLRIAVLPFDNVSKDPDAGRVLTNTVITYLLSTGNFDVVEPGVINAAMGAEGVRLSEGVTMEICQKLQPKLSADAYIVGMVEEYGEVRIGADSYPSISFSTRLVNAHTADIIWAATISKTGADNVKLFDIGRISSLGKLSKQAVNAMAVSLSRSKNDIFVELALQQGNSVAGNTHTVNNGTGETTTTLATNPTTGNTSGQTAKYMDETPTYGEKELAALLKDVDKDKLGAVTYKKHYHDTIETKYQIGGNGKSVEVKLVDYRKPTISEKFVKQYNPTAQQSTFETLAAFTGESNFGYYHLDIVVGRFGLFLQGPKGNKADIDTLAKGIIALLK